MDEPREQTKILTSSLIKEYRKAINTKDKRDALKILQGIEENYNDTTYQYFDMYEDDLMRYKHNLQTTLAVLKIKKSSTVEKDKAHTKIEKLEQQAIDNTLKRIERLTEYIEKFEALDELEQVQKFIIDTKMPTKQYEITPYYQIQNNSFFGYGLPFKGMLSILTIDVYVMDLLKKIETESAGDVQNEIYKLIDQQETTHGGFLKDKLLDEIFEEAYNKEIKKQLQVRLTELNQLTAPPIDEVIRQKMNKCLVWNTKLNTIGTLFGLLLREGFIIGKQADVKRGLAAMFSNLSESSLKDNIGLIESKTEGKIKFDQETLDLLNEWIVYLATQKPKK